MGTEPLDPLIHAPTRLRIVATLAALFAEQPALKLCYGDTFVTDAAVAHLKKLAGLRTLDLRQTAVSDAGAKQLAEALPKCKILR